MSELSETTPNTPGNAETPLRVVLLGDDAIDARVRDDASIETVRLGSALEAIGEVAAPPASAAGRRTIVVVGPGREPEGDEGAFVNALRSANPDARVVRVGQNGATRNAGPYDAVLSGPATGALLRSVVGRTERAASNAGDTDGSVANGAEQAEVREIKGVTPCEQVGQTPTPPADPDEHEWDAPVVVSVPGRVHQTEGDASLLALLDLPRHAFERKAIGLIRTRSGIAGLRFIGASGQGEAEALVDEACDTGVEVRVGGNTAGRLVASGVDESALAGHAAWLSAWLAHHEKHRSLRRAAFTDPLTGAWNRRYFDGFLAAALDRARNARRTVTVLVFDIDEFKKYNDNYGHPAGDEILIETVRALKSSVRPSDRVCRIGGDEFAVIFDEPEGPRQAGSRPPESVYVLAKRVQQKIGEKEFPKLGADACGTLTISGGLAAFPWDGHDAETLLGRADELACTSKRQGKNAITVGPGAERVCRGDDCID